MLDEFELPSAIRGLALDWIDDAILITDARLQLPGPRILYANPAFLAMTGYPASELSGDTPRLLQGPETDQRELDRLRHALERGQECTGGFINHRRDGEPFVQQWRIRPVHDDHGAVTHFVAISRDVTHSRRRDRRQRELEALARVQREVATGGLEIDTVRQKVADVVLNISGAESAVVEEPDAGDMVYRAVAGDAAGHLGTRVPIDRSLSGICYRELRPIVCADTALDDRVATEPARAVGFRSGVLVPLCQGYRCFGVIKAYSSTVDRFSTAERDLLQLASGVLATALESAHTFRDELHRRAALVDALPLMIAYIDRDGCFREVNSTCERWFGLPHDRLLGRELRTILGEDGFAAIEPYMAAALKGESVHFQTRGSFRSGEQQYIEGDYTPDRDSRGRIRGFYAVVRDVTGLQTLYVDYLTKVGNRRQLEEKGGGLIASAQRYGRPLSLIMMDVDHFKAINDRHGHQAGDTVLKQLGEILGAAVRTADLLARWGGEEFAIVAPETGEVDAAALAERIRARIAARDFAPVGHVTMSFGAAALTGPEDDMQALHARADRALYEAKHRGRNRVVVWGATTAVSSADTDAG